MKKIVFLFIFSYCFCFSQVQIGQDIDGESAFNFFGETVSISSNGSIVAVGSPGKYIEGNNYTGQASVFKNINGGWVQIGSSLNGDASLDLFGKSVSISSDGNILAVGAPGNDINGNRSGLVRVFSNINDEWVQLGTDIYGESSYDGLGEGVSLSSDGNTLAIGESGYGPDYHLGRVRIFENIEDNWIPTSNSSLPSFNQNGDIELSNDSNVLVYGSTNVYGVTRIHKKNEGVWTYIDGFTGSFYGDNCGESVNLSADGSIIAFSLPGYDDHIGENGYLNNIGKVIIYEIVGEELIQKGSYIIGENQNDFIGKSLSFSADGSVLAIGGIGSNYSYGGFVKLYKFIEEDWVVLASDIIGEADHDHSAESISLSADGTILAIGAKNNDGSNTDSGHVRIYDVSESTLSIKNNYLEYFSLFPNPAQNQFTIKLYNNTELKNVKVYNNLGQLVLTSKETTLDSSKLAVGLYVVEIETNKGKGTKKLIIE